MNCPNGDCKNEATKLCDGCDQTLCVACYVLHNRDLDGEGEAGFVVINTANMAVIGSFAGSLDDPVTIFCYMDAKEVAAQARMDGDNDEIYVYRVGPVGELGDEE